MADPTIPGLRLQVAGLEEKNANLTDALLRARKQITDLQGQVDLLNRPPSTMVATICSPSLGTYLSPRSSRVCLAIL